MDFTRTYTPEQEIFRADLQEIVSPTSKKYLEPKSKHGLQKMFQRI